MSNTLAADGLPARLSRQYAQEKLYYLQRYLDIVNKAMRKKWPFRAFVDLMAGPGRCVLEEDGTEFDGSPLLALRADPPFTHVALTESSTRLAEALKRRVTSQPSKAKIEVIGGDCNDTITIDRIRTFVPPNALAIVFVDMLGADVRYETIASLTRKRKMDLLLTFQVGDLRRNVRDALIKPAEGKRLDLFFGTRDWRTVVPKTGDPILALTTFYEDRLKTLAYPYVGRSLDVMKNSKNAEQYRLLLASKNARGPEFFEKIAQISFEGNRRLPF
jgi:three-Cys-motif partner protein